MAKLGSYYGLCPIIDQKSLLGITNDSESGHVLVTLGKNIAIKYKLADQKQIISWRTKEKFTSPIIYYVQEEKYCGVFNQMYLKLWTDENEHLDKYKKLKFNKPIQGLVDYAKQTFILFQNGAFIPLGTALEEHKDLEPVSVINKGERIIDVHVNHNKNELFAGLVIEDANNRKHFLFNLLDNADISRIVLEKVGVFLSGCVLITNNEQKFILLTLWSDGKMLSHSLDGNNEETLITILDIISCKEEVTMLALSGDYIAMYGADNSQEGALLVIYNIHFKVTLCKQSFKLYTGGTKLWCLENNLFLCVGQNLAVVPHCLSTEQLATLVGSHKTKNNDPDIAIIQELILTDWDDDAKKSRKMKGAYNDRIKELSQQGLPEVLIVEDVLPKHIEDNDLESIEACLNYFDDIPENFRIQLLNYILSVKCEHFPSKIAYSNLPESLAPIERCHLIDKILMIPYSSIVLLPQLRAHLSVTNALLLLRYICYLLSEDGHMLGADVPQCERKLIDWGSIILDANYQKFLLSKDRKIVEVLSYFNELVKVNLCCLDDVQQLLPIVASLQSGKYLKHNTIQNTMYCIENIKLH